MDVMECVKKIVDVIGGDKAQIASFVADPLKIAKSILGIDISNDMLKLIVKGVQDNLGDLIPKDAFAGILGSAVSSVTGAAADAAKDAADKGKGGILDALKKIF